MLRNIYTTALVIALGTTAANGQSPCGAPSTLHSGYYGVSGQDGIFFDIVASTPVTIKCFETYFTHSPTNKTNIYIWYRHGSQVGVATDPSQWIAIDSIIDFVIPAIQTTLTHIPIAVNVPILAGDTAAFYITNGDKPGQTNTGVRYDDLPGGGGAPGLLTATDGSITMFSGSGSWDRWVIFTGTRHYAGRVSYSSGTTGIEGSLSTLPGEAYPNPATDQVTVDLGVAGSADMVRVLDALGRVQPAEVTMNDGLAQVDVSALAPGSYMLMIVEGDLVRELRFVKN